MSHTSKTNLNIKKKKVKSFLNYFKFTNCVSKIFGLFPFTIKETTSGPKNIISVWGAILAIIHITTYTYCFVNVVKLGKDGIYTRYIPKTAITSIDHRVGMHVTFLAVVALFLNIMLTLKAQRKMLTLFYRAERLCGNFVSKRMYKVVLLCIPIIFNFTCGVIAATVLFFHLLHRHTINGAFYRIVVMLLPHAYVFSRVTHFIFCVSYVQLGFEHISNVMNSVNKK